jgi:hypothetical protein
MLRAYSWSLRRNSIKLANGINAQNSGLRVSGCILKINRHFGWPFSSNALPLKSHYCDWKTLLRRNNIMIENSKGSGGPYRGHIISCSFSPGRICNFNQSVQVPLLWLNRQCSSGGNFKDSFHHQSILSKFSEDQINTLFWAPIRETGSFQPGCW